MSTIKTSLLMLSLFSTLVFSQQKSAPADSLSGYVDVKIDISELKDTSGIFDIRIAGKSLQFSKRNNVLSAKCYLDEPRRSYLTFYSHQTIANNLDKPLSSISAEYKNYYEFFAMPGKLYIIAKNTVHDSQIVNASQPQVDYARLLKQQEAFELNFAKENQDLMLRFKPVISKKINVALQSVFEEKAKLAMQKFESDVVLKYIKANPDSPTAMWQLDEHYNSVNADVNLLASVHQNFTDRIKALPTAQRIYSKISGR